MGGYINIIIESFKHADASQYIEAINQELGNIPLITELVETVFRLVN